MSSQQTPGDMQYAHCIQCSLRKSRALRERSAATVMLQKDFVTAKQFYLLGREDV